MQILNFPLTNGSKLNLKKKKKKKTAQGVSEKKFKSVDGRGVSTIAHPEPSAQVS